MENVVKKQPGRTKRAAVWTAGIIAGLILVLGVAVYFSTYHPDDVQPESVVSPENAPVLEAGQKIKVLSWNVQYMAGKNYVFFYDTVKGDGPDIRPSSKDIVTTLAEVARVIKAENPDIILLQEVDYRAKRTDYEDQLAKLLAMLPKEYASYVSAYYWKAAFVPHPKIMGRVGMKNVVISKYKISEAVRYQLPIIPGNILFQQMNFKRAILEAVLPVRGGAEFSAMNTHLDSWAQGSDTMERQVFLLMSILKKRTAAARPWVIGGDFNLLPPGNAWQNLPADQRVVYNEKSELQPMFTLYNAVPTLDEIYGADAARWFTHFPNDPLVKAPDRTIDFIFASKSVTIGKHYVRSADTLKISDHMPVVAEITLGK